jgi:adenylate cyclase class 2
VAREIEIKLRVDDLEEFRRTLKKLGARPVMGNGGRVHEFNVIFDTREKKLAKRGELLRIRRETPARRAGRGSAKDAEETTVTFKRRPEGKSGQGRHKVQEEIESRVDDGDAFAAIFEGLGYRPWFRYEKFRTKFQLSKRKPWAKGLEIDLDETPIGTFVELEGPPRAIDRVAKELGYSKPDYIVTNYLVLYREECRRKGEKPGDMVFRKAK